jgi:hypothetical protein
MSAPNTELAHLEDAINELAAHLFGRSVELALANGDLAGSIKVALDHLRTGNAMLAQTVLQDALNRTGGEA